MTLTADRLLATVIVVSWNTAQETESCVRSVLANDAGRQFEVIVVDNASSDDTVARLGGIDARLRLIVNEENVGFARACNQGMAASEAPFLVLLNSDATVQDDVISRCVQWLEDHNQVGMMGCEVVNPVGRRTYTAFRRLSVRQSLFENLWLYRLLPRDRRAKALLGGYWDGFDDVGADWLAGVFLCLRRGVFQLSGGFDERFFMYGEDSEWGMRLRRMGVEIVYVPSVGRIVHSGAVSSQDVWTTAERLRRGHEGGLRAYAMLRGGRRADCYRRAQLLGYTVRWAVYGGAGRVMSSSYYCSQADHYKLLRSYYLDSSSVVDHAR